jgi:hypothetical protein
MIKASAIPEIVLIQDGNKIISQPHFSMTFVERSGALVDISDCICTSKYQPNRTINIRIASSGQKRKVRTCTIVKFNGQEVYL